MKQPREKPRPILNPDRRVWKDITSYVGEGIWEDGWVGERGAMTITLPAGTKWLRLLANKMHHPEHLRLIANVNGVEVRREILAVGHFVVDLPLKPGTTTVRAEFSASETYVPAEVGVNGDDHRNLSWIVVAVQVSE